jgi:hypothetical protein
MGGMQAATNRFTTLIAMSEKNTNKILKTVE